MKKIALGIVGLGRAGWGMHRVESIDRFPGKFNVSAICDLDTSRLDEWEQKYPDVHKYTDFEEFLHDATPEIIVIAIPSRLHIQYAIKALETGKYVLIEKPIALSQNGLDLLRDAEKRFPGKLLCRQNRRFEACFNHVKEIIASGILGQVFDIRLARHNFGFRDDWQTLKKFGGGMFNNWGPHLIDHALQFLDYQVTKPIWSELRRIAAVGDAEDHFKVILSNENCSVECNVSGGVALADPIYAVRGTRGSLISTDEKTIKLKYLEKNFELPADAHADEDYPSREKGFSSKYQPVWKEEEISVCPSNGWQLDDFYLHIWNYLRKEIPLPVTNDQAFAAAQVIIDVKKQHPEFMTAQDEL